MMLSVDRIGLKKIVCIDDDGEVKKIDKELVDEGVKEGDIIYLENERYHVSEGETNAAREEILALEEELFEE